MQAIRCYNLSAYRAPSNPSSPSSFPFPFLSLCPEIRQRIYHFTLTTPEITISTFFTNLNDAVLSQDPFALLRTCRQIYTEARLVFYTANTFNFPCYRFYRDSWNGRSVLSQEQQDAIQSIVLDEGRLYFFDGERWIVPWVVYIKTFPGLKKVVLRGDDIVQKLERATAAEGTLSWREFLTGRECGGLQVVVDSR